MEDLNRFNKSLRQYSSREIMAGNERAEYVHKSSTKDE